MMAVWCALFIVQALLASRKQLSLHRSLGVVGGCLLAIIFFDSIAISITSVRLSGPHLFAPQAAQMAFLLGLLAAFVGLATAGLAFYRKPRIHKRLMIISTLALLPAGLIRMDEPGPIFPLPIWALMLIVNVLVILVAVVDRARVGRIASAYVFAFGYLLILELGVLLLANSQQWTMWVTEWIS
jgi:hypothetical protein